MKKKASKRGTHIRLSGWDYTFHFLNYLLFGVFTILCIYPFYYIIINSISDGTMVDLGRVLWYPIGFTLSNYKSCSRCRTFTAPRWSRWRARSSARAAPWW